MSVSGSHAEVALRLTLLCALLGSSNVVLGADDDLPDLEFLEYLGSWDGTDEDWVLLAEADTEGTEASSDLADPEPQEDKVAELENED